MRNIVLGHALHDTLAAVCYVFYICVPIHFNIHFIKGRCDGRIFEYNTRTKALSVVLNGLCFPNGVELTNDEEHLIVAETFGSRMIIVDRSTWKTKHTRPLRGKARPKVFSGLLCTQEYRLSSIFCNLVCSFSLGVFNPFKHVAQLINKWTFCGPPTVQLLQSENCCTCTVQQ